jgi:hypothetical protein
MDDNFFYYIFNPLLHGGGEKYVIELLKHIYLNTKWTSSKFSRRKKLDLRRCPTTRSRGDAGRLLPPPPPGGAYEGGACSKQQNCQLRPQLSQVPACLAQEVEVPWRYGAIPFDA